MYFKVSVLHTAQVTRAMCFGSDVEMFRVKDFIISEIFRTHGQQAPLFEILYSDFHPLEGQVTEGANKYPQEGISTHCGVRKGTLWQAPD